MIYYTIEITDTLIDCIKLNIIYAMLIFGALMILTMAVGCARDRDDKIHKACKHVFIKSGVASVYLAVLITFISAVIGFNFN